MRHNIRKGQILIYRAFSGTKYLIKVTKVEDTGLRARITKVYENGRYEKYPDADNWRSKIWVWNDDIVTGRVTKR